MDASHEVIQTFAANAELLEAAARTLSSLDILRLIFFLRSPSEKESNKNKLATFALSTASFPLFHRFSSPRRPFSASRYHCCTLAWV
jgi:hypothetical protein